MLKKLITIVLPFLLPFLLYAIYAGMQRLSRRQEAESGRAPIWSGATVGWLSLAGALMVAATLITFRFVGSPAFLEPAPAALQAPPTSFPSEAR